MKKKRGHLHCGPDEHYVIEPCGGRGRALVTRNAPPGTSLLPGEGLVQVTPLEDGHVEYEIIHHAKPAQVATPAYRRGWEATFAGNKTVN